MENIKILRAGYDGLDVSFCGTMPPSVLEALERGKTEAVRSRQDALVQISPRLSVHVAETGAKGGYAYRVDTGPDGETWFLKRSDTIDWNIRVSCKSAMLATLGYEGAKARLYARLKEFGAFVESESIGRVDFAFDFTAPAEFEIDPSLVVAHVNSGVREHDAKMKVTEDETAITCIASRARKVETLTIGKMPGRQVTVYNKTAEVKARGKAYWWQIWKVGEGTQVYRLEVRAGKKYLKERVGVTTWADLEEKLPAILHATLLKIRLCDPLLLRRANVTQRGYHPVWNAALTWLRSRWEDCIKGVEGVRIIVEERKRYAEIFTKLTRGLFISYANVCGVELNEFSDFIDAVASDAKYVAEEKSKGFERKWQKSADRYALLTGRFTGWPDVQATA